MDGITRDQLDSGLLRQAIEDDSVAGVTFNPTALGAAIAKGRAYDATITKKLKEGLMGEDLYLEVALDDLRHAADLLRPVYDQTEGVDGWVSLGVSPLRCCDATSALSEARDLYMRMRRPNFFIEIPGTRENLTAIEEAIFAGVPVNATLLFSREHYVAAAEALLRGMERRLDAGLRLNVACLASVSVSPWDDAAMNRAVPDALRDKIGIAMARRIYKASRELMVSQRWERVYNAGSRPQRILWAATVPPGRRVSSTFYIEALLAPFTVNIVSDGVLTKLAEQNDIGAVMPPDGGDCEAVLAASGQAGIELDALAAELQNAGRASLVASTMYMMTMIASKCAAITGCDLATVGKQDPKSTV